MGAGTDTHIVPVKKNGLFLEKCRAVLTMVMLIAAVLALAGALIKPWVDELYLSRADARAYDTRMAKIDEQALETDRRTVEALHVLDRRLAVLEENLKLLVARSGGQPYSPFVPVKDLNK